MATSEFAPPDNGDLDEIREYRMKEIKMESVVKEIAIYSFFVFVIFFLSYQQRDLDSFGLGENVRNHFVGKFEKVNELAAYWFTRYP